MRVPLLLSPKEYQELPKSSVVPLDCSWHMPNVDRSAMAEYMSGPRLPNAKRFDLDEVAELDPQKNLLSLTHMLPTKERFVEGCRKLGIKDDDHVVLYDTIGVFASPRGAFTFKAFGHDKVSILDGGLPRYIAEGGEVETGEVPNHGEIHESEYKGGEDRSGEFIKSYEQVVENSKDDLKSTSAVLVDLRSQARFTAEAPEPRANLSSGHMPNSVSLPYATYVNPSSSDKPYTSLKSPDEIESSVIAAVGGNEQWRKIKNGEKGMIFSCGSGMTAATGWLANEVLKEKGKGAAQKTALYDESWSGYASRKESKIVKGSSPT